MIFNHLAYLLDAYGSLSLIHTYIHLGLSSEFALQIPSVLNLQPSLSFL